MECSKYVELLTISLYITNNYFQEEYFNAFNKLSKSYFISKEHCALESTLRVNEIDENHRNAVAKRKDYRWISSLNPSQAYYQHMSRYIASNSPIIFEFWCDPPLYEKVCSVDTFESSEYSTGNANEYSENNSNRSSSCWTTLSSIDSTEFDTNEK